MSKRIFRIFIFIVAITVFLVCVAFEIGPEYAWALAFLQYVPYYVFLIPALAAFAISFMLTQPWRWVAAIALVSVWAIMMDLRIGIGDTGTERIRVMTYNVKDYVTFDNDAGLANISNEVAEHDPDILVLQDAQQLSTTSEEAAAALVLIFGKRHIYTYGQYAVASRYPLRGCKPGKISFREHPHTYVHCIVDTGFTQIDLYTAHFLTPRRGLNAVRHERFSGIDDWAQNVSDRMEQARALSAAVKSSIRPVILAGDFNAPNSSLAIRTLESAGVRDAFAAAGTGYGFTYGHSLRPGISFLRIDHIFVSPSIGVADCFVGGKSASPHRPVIADLLLNRTIK